MIGQRSPVDPNMNLAETIKQMGARIAELERARSVGPTNGTLTTATNGSGQVTISHGLSSTPKSVVATGLASRVVIRVDAKTSTTFTLRFYSAVDGSVLASTAVGFDWAAFP